MKSYGVTIQIKLLPQYFHMVLFIEYVIISLKAVDEILWCDHSNETSSAVFSRGIICLTLRAFALIVSAHPYYARNS